MNPHRVTKQGLNVINAIIEYRNEHGISINYRELESSTGLHSDKLQSVLYDLIDKGYITCGHVPSGNIANRSLLVPDVKAQ